MSYQTPFTLWITTLYPLYGHPVHTPLFYPDQLSYISSYKHLGSYIMQLFQRRYLDKGEHLSVLGELPQVSVTSDELRIKLTTAQLPYLPEPLELSLPIALITLENQELLAICPTAQARAYGSDQDEVTGRLREAIYITFKHQRVRESAYHLLQHLWWDDATFQSVSRPLTFYTSRELEERRERMRKSWLKTVARQVKGAQSSRYAVIKREDTQHIQELIESPFRRSLILIGMRGVGKSELIYQWVSEYRRDDIWETSAITLISKLMAGAGWQANLNQLIRDVKTAGATLYIKSFAELFEVGRSVGQSLSIGEVLREEITQGKLRIITECSHRERASLELRYPDLLSTYHTVEVPPPTPQELHQIISEKGRWLCERSPLSVTLPDEGVAEIISLHQRFSPYSSRPARPLYFIRSMLSRLMTRQTRIAMREMEAAGFSTAQALRAIERGEWSLHQSEFELELDRALTVELFCEESDLPLELISPESELNLDACRAFFSENIFGQPEAISVVVDSISTIKSGLSRRGQPLASMLFVGSTGVGKTEMVKVLAEYLFSSRERVIRFDMSEFADPINVMRLTGLHSGEDGLLTSAVRDQPFSVLLFDEVEKAHPDFFDLLLQLLGAGRLSDRRGDTVDFCSVIVVMTSNLGASALKRGATGFTPVVSSALDAQRARQSATRDHFERAVQRALRPELYNRIGHIVPFYPLDRVTMSDVLSRELRGVTEREGIAFRDHLLELHPSAVQALGELGYSERYGARQVQRAIREQLVYPLARIINQARPKPHRFTALDQDRTPPEDHPLLDQSKRLSITLSPRGELTNQEPEQEGSLLEQTSALRRALYQVIQLRHWTELEDALLFLKNDLSHTGRTLKRLEAKLSRSHKSALDKRDRHLKRLRTQHASLKSNQHFLSQLRGRYHSLYQELRSLDAEITLGALSIRNERASPRHEAQELARASRLRELRAHLSRALLFMYYYRHRSLTLGRVIMYGRPQDICTLARYYLRVAETLKHSTSCEPLWREHSFTPQKRPHLGRSHHQELARFLESEEEIERADQLSQEGTLLGIIIHVVGIGAHAAWRVEAGAHEMNAQGEDSGSRCLVFFDDELTLNWGSGQESSALTDHLRDTYHNELAIRELNRLLDALELSVSDAEVNTVNGEGLLKAPVAESQPEERVGKTAITTEHQTVTSTEHQSPPSAALDLLRGYHQRIIEAAPWTPYTPPLLSDLKAQLAQAQLEPKPSQHRGLLSMGREVKPYPLRASAQAKRVAIERDLITRVLSDLDETREDTEGSSPQYKLLTQLLLDELKA